MATNGYKPDRLNAWTRAILAYAYFLGVVAVLLLVVIFRGELGKVDPTLAGVVVTALVGLAQSAASHYFAHRAQDPQKPDDSTNPTAPASPASS
jgi:hypothetical protein